MWLFFLSNLGQGSGASPVTFVPAFVNQDLARQIIASDPNAFEINPDLAHEIAADDPNLAEADPSIAHEIYV